MGPNAGKVLSPVGFKVVLVNVKNGVIREFAVSEGKGMAPRAIRPVKPVSDRR